MRWLGFLASFKHILRFMESDLSDSTWKNMCNYVVILTKQDMWVVSEVTNDVQKWTLDTKTPKCPGMERVSRVPKATNLEGETRRVN